MNWTNWAMLSILIGLLAAAVIFVIWRASASQVYLYYDASNGVSTLEGAQSVAANLGANVATPAQVGAAYAAGASWCIAGFASDGNVYYPYTGTTGSGCTHGLNGPMSCSAFGGNCGALLYGPKPSSGTANVVPFNGSQWSQWKWYEPFH